MSYRRDVEDRMENPNLLRDLGINPLNAKTIKVGDKCNWKNQPERLVYLGLCEPRNGHWHQFAKVEEPDVVWCEVKNEDLSMLERTQ